MIREMVLPQLAMGMSEGTVVQWCVEEGGLAKRDQAIAIIETEKVSTELPAPYGGYVQLVVATGETVPVETVIARIADTEDEYRNLTSGGAAAAAAKPAQATEDVHSSATPGGAIDIPGNVPKGKSLRISGLARKLAQLNGVELSGVSGTGPGGRIVRRDILSALEVKTAVASAPVSGIYSSLREKTRIPLTGMRKAIADRLSKSKVSAAHTYVFVEIDVSKLEAARAVMLERAEELGGRVSSVALYARALAMALKSVPICNATLVGDEIIVWENVNIGVAVALSGKEARDSALVVPVIKNAQDKGVLAIDLELKALAAKARSRQLSPEDMADGTVSLSSTAGFIPGTWSVGTSILNLPQVVIFQPGSPIQKPVVVDGQIAVRTILPCSLTFDHRAVDGEPIGRLLKKIVDLLSNPELLAL